MKEEQAEFETPEHAAQALASRSARAGAPSSGHQVCLGPSASKGYFKLSWTAKTINSGDWIGIYTDPSKPDNEYISGNANWAWAKKENPFTTAVPVRVGYEARYLVNDGSGKYHSVARTGAYPEKICSLMPLAIRIANGKPTPNKLEAIMSRSGGGRPKQATFTALDKSYTISLAPGFWLNMPNGSSFEVEKGDTSAPYQLDPNAPLGEESPYMIAARKDEPPEMFIEP